MPLTTVLSIAASDGSSGAGIQRDNTTIQALGGYALNVLTAITAQNHTSVHAAYPLPVDTIRKQMEALLTHYDIDAIKIGVLADTLVTPVAHGLRHGLRHMTCPIVLDPVIRSTSGFTFIHDVNNFADTLLPLATHVTPNVDEAQMLTGQSQKSSTDTEQVAYALRARGARNIIITNADKQDAYVTDTLFSVEDSSPRILKRDKIKVTNSHGTGCAFSSALALFLAQGHSLDESHRRAVVWVESTLRSSGASGAST